MATRLRPAVAPRKETVHHPSLPEDDPRARDVVTNVPGDDPGADAARGDDPSGAGPLSPSLLARVRGTEPRQLAVPTGFSLAVCVRRSPLSRLAPTRFSDGSEPGGPGSGFALQAVLSPAAAGARGLGPREVLVTQPGGAGTTLLLYGLYGLDGPGRGAPAPGDAPSDRLVDRLCEQLRGMLRLDEDLGVFYRLAAQDPELQWVPPLDAGRTLRSATAFEDLVKCAVLGAASDQRASALCAALCTLGPVLDPSTGRRAFPGPAELAACSVEQLGALGLGRLARSLHRLAVLCDGGGLHAESLRRTPTRLSRVLADGDEATWDDLVHEELEWQERLGGLLSRLPGLGERAVGELLLLLGCYEDVQIHHRARAAWQSRFPPRSQPRSRSRPQPDDPEAAARAEVQRREAQQREVQRLLRRVAPYGLYRGLAQSLLVAGEGSAAGPGGPSLAASGDRAPER